MTKFNECFALFSVTFPVAWETLTLFFPKLRGKVFSDKRIPSLNNISPRLFRTIVATIFLTTAYFLYLQHYITTFVLPFCLYIIFTSHIERLIIYLNKDEDAKQKLATIFPPLSPLAHKILITALIIATLWLLWIW